MKRLLWLPVALFLVLGSASTAMAHGRFFLGINLGFPFYFYPYPAYQAYPYQPYVYPSYPASYPRRYYYAPPRVYRDPDGTRTVVEKIYANGRLVERRVKTYRPDWNGYR